MIEIKSINLDGFRKKLTHAMAYISTEAKEDAKFRCPVKLGLLQESIKIDRKSIKEFDIGAYGVWYADAIEYGDTFTYPDGETMADKHGEHNPENPVLSWQALRKRGDVGLGYSLPYLRPYAYDFETQRKDFKKGFV